MTKKFQEVLKSWLIQIDLSDDLWIGFTSFDWYDQHVFFACSILDEFCNRLTMDGQLLNRNVISDIQLPEDCFVFMDEKLFVRALENITNNAFRYTNNDGNITIKSFVNEKTKTPIISIKDDGRGISKKDLPYIFDPLYRGTNSRREDGKGLGLSVVKTVVDCHGWNLHVKSEEGKGSEFIIQLGM